MSKLKKLAGDTIIYGASTILGRLLNWLLMPLYIRLMDPAQVGGVVNIYSYIAVLLVVLTFGFETGYFRFAKDGNRAVLLKNLGSLIAFCSLVFCVLVYVFRNEISFYLGNEFLVAEYFVVASWIIALDALMSIPFADLRINNHTVRFALLKFLSVILNIVIVLFYMLLCPYLIENGYEAFELIYDPNNKLYYVFLSNFISSLLIAIIIVPKIFFVKAKYDRAVIKLVLRYSYPIMIVGLFGMLIQNIDKILMPHLISENAMDALAIYGANYKIGILMAIFIQSYRLAFEPFFFKEGKQNATKDLYARVLKYFVIFGMIIFVGVLVFIDVVNYLLLPEYFEGNVIIPFILLGQLFFGIYYSLSLWYKLTDRTNYGALISGIGAMLAIIGNIILVPLMGYLGAAITSLVCFVLMTIISYLLGQKYYPINYPLFRIGLHIIVGVLAVYISHLLSSDNQVFHFAIKGIIFVSYFAFLYMIERKELIKIIS
ncbi:lipopolysaccharide biosynthesis protein [Carboxylicivirga sp. M1479]|uniref:lipopolysaccharide biosynthesis protein n=1 Tax=Carboxylicivirga sp. M1479 TaxID=2594476 RepID=UPI00117895D4|nr:polysaccharide biosynthesis C-terminal domain-containing protein [Carboxylicivirga sp. M1479]TRX71657.1 oligosaccharide flippase family protein [Carboxylicivirga sp. M1479]